MKILKYIGASILGISVAGFIWLAWFLITTPASDFDTQGPGLLGAILMFGGQLLALGGVFLLLAWKAISAWPAHKERRSQAAAAEHGQFMQTTRNEES